ncbi:unnamed protein product, partial [Ectocarpus sp. 12 AP-2014]
MLKELTFTTTRLAGAAFLAAAITGVWTLPTATPAFADGGIVGLITKTNTNPFFVKMKEGAEAKASELGMELRSFAG